MSPSPCSVASAKKGWNLQEKDILEAQQKNRICYNDNSLWLHVWVAQAGQPAAKCVSEFPMAPTHSQLDLTGRSGLYLTVWVRLGTSDLLVCTLAGSLLCHFLSDGIFRGATQLGKVICRLSFLVTQLVPNHSLFGQWNLQQPGVWVSGLQRMARICCHDHAFWVLRFVLVDMSNPLFLSLCFWCILQRNSSRMKASHFCLPLDQRHESPSRATDSHPPGLAKGSNTPQSTMIPAKQVGAKGGPAKWILLSRQEQGCHCQYWDFSTVCITSVCLLPLKRILPATVEQAALNSISVGQ